MTVGRITFAPKEPNVWELLADVLAGPGPRPKNSVTASEVAAERRVSLTRAGQILRADKRLERVEYRKDDNRPGVCFVPVKKQKKRNA